MINPTNFLLNEIPNFNPYSVDYKDFWKLQKRKCIEGEWVGGVWCPGNLYTYLNMWHIKVNKTLYSKQKIISRPFFREIEWEKAYIYVEARGFSGFSNDNEVTCFHGVRDYKPNENNITVIPETCYKQDGTMKLYESPRTYLRKTHKGNMGKPLFQNFASNVIDIESRGGGKSYVGSCNIAHNFLFDGATDYDEYIEGRKNKTPLTSETLVGAIDTKYSNDLLTKVKLGLEYLPGSIDYAGRKYPSPLSVQISGSWMPAKSIKAEYDRKVKGGWEKGGSMSQIHHRSFKDNPLAGNGTRPGLIYLEEIGFFSNLLPSLGALRDTTADSGNKFGTIYMMGTGGDMSSGATEAAKSVFYNPEEFDCLAFPDLWENRATSIGFFCPPQMSDNEFLNRKTGEIDKDKALAKYTRRREKLKGGKNKKPLYDELQNNPLIPSEAFLVMNSNIFPIAELKERLARLEIDNIAKDAAYIGDFTFNEVGAVKWKPNSLLEPIVEFPLSKTDNGEGCVEIWEMPYRNDDGTVPYGLYIAGTDPYDHDKSQTGSLGSTFIYKRFNTVDDTYELPVAEYTGRPNSANEHYEILRKLLMFYNASCLYENERKGLFQYFDQKQCTYLLLDQPKTIDDIIRDSQVRRGKGMHMNKALKDYGEILIRDWLNEEYEEGKKNLNKIMSIPLLKELISYNDEGNFDRVISFMMVMYHRQELHKIHVDMKQKEVKNAKSFWNRKHFKKNNYNLESHYK